jgi:hypothetical protein
MKANNYSLSLNKKKVRKLKGRAQLLQALTNAQKFIYLEHFHTEAKYLFTVVGIPEKDW